MIGERDTSADAGGQLDEIGKVGFPTRNTHQDRATVFNTPARLKFLKTTTTGLLHIQQD